MFFFHSAKADSLSICRLGVRGTVTSRHSGITVTRHERRLLALVDVDDRDAEKGIFDELDKYCRAVYEEFIRKGYEHLITIRSVTNGSDRMSDLDGFEQRFTKDQVNATLAMISDNTRRL